MQAMTPFTAPVVDELSVRVVVDSRYERFLPKASHPRVRIEHVGRIPGRPLTTFAAEWGLSLHLASVQAGAKAQYLLDFGYTPEIINRNLDLLDIDPAAINGLILSHGHRDHFGGLNGFVNQHRGRMRGDLALYVGGETIFREKWIKEGGETVLWGAVDRGALQAQNVASICCPAPRALEGAFTAGYIERTSFEEVTGGSWVEDDHYSEAERKGKLVRDQHPDEHATCYIVKGRGLVVISSCGHAGIINTVRSAMAAANVDTVHAVLGGFHLGLAPLDYLQHSLRELEALNPDVIIPMHCTGAPFIEMMCQRMPEKVVYSNVGSRFTFGA
ncbi:MAG: MBL fold metallo-hydrolase [Betaproteobacteria bacterium]|nr:MBL fold metallo-hydrolase [Betaproteobacteria bacterium]